MKFRTTYLPISRSVFQYKVITINENIRCLGKFYTDLTRTFVSVWTRAFLKKWSCPGKYFLSFYC